MTEANLRLVLTARVRADGRWEAHVVSVKDADAPRLTVSLPTECATGLWPSVNGPTPAVALDALEAELHALILDRQPTITDVLPS